MDLKELNEIYDFLKSVKITNDVIAIDVCYSLVQLSEKSITKGDSTLKDVIIDVIKDPKYMLILVRVWNIRNPGKMIPNSIRRAIKKILESRFSQDELINVQSFEGIYLKDVIKLSRPRPFMVEMNFIDAEASYNNNISIITPDGIVLNKKTLGVSFDKLNLTYNNYYHKDIFKIIIDNNI